MNALTLDLTAQFVDLRIGNLFELYLNTKVVAVIVGIVVVLRVRKVVNDRLAQRKANTWTVPPQIDLLDSNNPFDDFA